MLGKEDLSRLAEVKRLSLRNAEKDYVLELLLYLIYTYAGKELVFKGGTALYKIYGLNRFSEDLDFTLASRKFKIERMLANILRGLESLGISAIIQEKKRYKNEINIRLAVSGPLYDGRKESLATITINISTRERAVKLPMREKIITLYKELTAFDVYAMDLHEILAEKVRAIMTRNKARDMYDLWFLIRKGISFDAGLTNKKLKIYNMKFKKEEFIKKIEEKKDMWETDLKAVIIGALPEFGFVKNEILKWLHNP